MRAHLDLDNLPAGTMVDNWRVVRRLGGGAYGTTYLVEKEGVSCAMKVARHREQSRDERNTDERTQRELSCLLTLRHRHIARVWAHGRWPHPKEGYLYLVMDYVEGHTLSQWKEAVCPTPHEVVVLVEKVMGAVAYMHGLGILHRDLKPDNLLVGKDGEPVVVDYGAAHFPLAPRLTKRGLPPGTPRYTSPEAARFDLTHRHDKKARYEYTVADELYALGVTLYDLLTDPWPCTRPQPLPVGGSTPPDHAHEVNERVPVALSLFTAKLLERAPDQRPESVEKARRQLAEFVPLEAEEWMKRPVSPPPPLSAAELAKPRPKSRRGMWRRALGAGVGLGVLLVAGAYLALHGATPEPLPLPAPPPVAERAPPRVPPAPSPGPPTSTSLVPAAELAPEPAPALALPPTSTQEKAPTMKARSAPAASTPSPCSQQQAPPRGSPTWRAWCQCASVVGTLAAFQAGCTGPQVRPASEPCPPEVRDSYTELKLEDGSAVHIEMSGDPGKPLRGHPMVRVKEGPITGVLQDSQGMPEGTRLFGELRITDPAGRATIRYTLAQLPNGKKYPVCIDTRFTNTGTVKAGAIDGPTFLIGAVWERWHDPW